jgi:hypothetical protein
LFLKLENSIVLVLVPLCCNSRYQGAFKAISFYRPLMKATIGYLLFYHCCAQSILDVPYGHIV